MAGQFARAGSMMGGAPKPRGYFSRLVFGPAIRPDQLVQLGRCPERSCTLDLEDLTAVHVTFVWHF